MKISEILVFENDDFIILDKPSGLLSIPDRKGKEVSLKKMLQENYDRVFTIHRLDKGTSGLIMFAKNELAHKYFSRQFENRQTIKIYLGLIVGSLANKKSTLDSPISEHPSKKGLMVINRKGKESVTDYEVLEDYGIYSWVRFQIYTGRTHQIRVHMKDAGHPIVCDELYGNGKPILLSSFKHNFKLSKNEEEERPILNRLGLHAYQLKFADADNRQFEFEAPVPRDLIATRQQLFKTRRNQGTHKKT